MAQSSACRSPCQNPHNGKDKFAGGTATKSSNCRTPALAATRASIPAAVPVVAPPTPPWLDTWKMTSSGSSEPF